LSDRHVQIAGNDLQVVQKIVILFPLLSLKHRIFRAAIAFVEDMVAAEFSGQQVFHERPVHAE
jgi:hypothetical protein